MQTKKNFFSLFLVLALAFVLVGGQIPAGANPGGTAKVIISFHEAPGQSGAALIKRAGGQIKRQYNLVPAIAASVPEQALKGLAKNPNIRLIEPDIKIYAIDAEMDNSWGVKHIGSAVVHESGNQGEGIKVGVLDTGIDHRHSDLDGNFAGGYNFIDNNTRTMDDNGHGTHVAGTIAAEDDGAGVVGVAPQARIYAYKILDRNGGGNTSDIIAALEMAVADGIQVTNNSYGWGVEYGSIDAVEQAFVAAANAGIINIAAAGNNGDANDASLDNVGYPARYDSVIAVAATDQSDRRASFSSTGPDVEISAPGVNITSTYLRRSYASGSGTSMACPHVTGTVALMLKGGVLPENVRGVLQNTADDLGAAGLDPVYGYGLVNAEKAALADIDNPPAIEIISPSEGAFVSGNVEITVSAADDKNSDLNVEFYLDSAWIGADDTPDASGNYSFIWASSGYSEGVHTISAQVADTAGNTANDSVSITLNNDNQTPAAVASFSPAEVYTNTQVSFIGSDSYDPDGEDLNYSWDFGDGSYNSEADPVHTYGEAGNYTVVLTVSDAFGGSDSAKLLITVNQQEVKTISAAISGMSVNAWAIFHEANVAVTVTEADGITPVSGASVSGDWSGLVSGSSSGTTDQNGQISFTSPRAKKIDSGTFTFSVNNVSHPNYDWDNAIVSGSVSY